MPPKKSTTAKKPAATKKESSAASKVAPAHPPFSQMISEAITALKDRQGSSRQALKKYITENYKVNEQLFSKAFKRYLAAGIENGTFVQPKGPSGAIKLNKEKKASSPKPKTAAAKKAAPVKKESKPKAAPAKKPVAKKAASTKTKQDVPPKKKVAPGTKAKAAKAKTASAKKAAPKKATAKAPGGGVTKKAPAKKAATKAAPKKSATKAK